MKIELVDFKKLTQYFTQISVLIIILILILLGRNSWKEHKQLTSIKSQIGNIESYVSEKDHNTLHQVTTLSLQLQERVDQLQEKFTELVNSTEKIEATEPGYQLRAVLRLTTLAVMHLYLGKEENLAKDLLKQAINKLVSLNDSRLNPILYNLQDEYAKLLDGNQVIYEVHKVWQRIDQVRILVDQLQEPAIVSEDLFAADNINNKKNALSYFKIEMLRIYLEQAKLAYLQGDTFLYKNVLEAIGKSLGIETWSSQVISEIQEHLKWLSGLEIKDYSLLLKAILNLEDQLKK